MHGRIEIVNIVAVTVAVVSIHFTEDMFSTINDYSIKCQIFSSYTSKIRCSKSAPLIAVIKIELAGKVSFVLRLHPNETFG